MDELHRLYEHQTMMAIGIYSFLDNLLANIPPTRSDTEGTTSTDLDCPPPTTGTEPLGPHSRSSGSIELPIGLISSVARVDTFRERQERIRLLSRLSARSTLEAITPRAEDLSLVPPSILVQHSVTGPETAIEDGENSTCKVVVSPGGYPEDVFIYLSEREKEEYTCAVCYCILKEAYQCTNEHRFCYGCIYTWSTGPSTGHDACPVCRCDGLYAKNFDVYTGHRSVYLESHLAQSKLDLGDYYTLRHLQTLWNGQSGNLVDRINRKRTRCTKMCCNWMGLLSEYSSHEHRRYTPYELDRLLSGSSKILLTKPMVQKGDSDPGTVVAPDQSSNIHSDTVITETPPSLDNAPLQNVGHCPTTCPPLMTALEDTNRLDQVQDAAPQGLARLRRNSQQARTRSNQSPINRVSSQRQAASNSSVSGALLLAQMRQNSSGQSGTSPSRFYSRQSSQSGIRPSLARRPIRTGAMTTESRTHSGSTGPNPMTSGGLSRNRSRASDSPLPARASPLGQIDEPERTAGLLLPVSRPTSSMSHRSSMDNRLLPLRRSSRINSPEQSPLRGRFSPPPVIPTDTRASGAYMAARTSIYSRTSSIRSQNIFYPSDDMDQRHETFVDRNANFSLPAINQVSTLTAGPTPRIPYERSHVNDGEEVEVERPNPNPSESNRQATTETTEEQTDQRPLEFHRLVPRRPGRVVEQLRETREQLAAMLRLMTLELEERRQHVLAATLETAARGRVLRQLNVQLSRESSSQDDSDLAMDTARSDSTNHGSSVDTEQRQNHHHQLSAGCMNILRNLRTPERPAQISQSINQQPLQNLTNRMLGERIYRLERNSNILASLRQRRLMDLSTVSADDDDDVDIDMTTASRTSSPNPNDNLPLSNLRLLNRLRMGSVSHRRPPEPSVLLMGTTSGRRHLSHLLSEIHYPRASITEWSSDEDDGDRL